MTDNHPTGSSSSSETPDHLRTTIPSGGLAHAPETHEVHGDAHDGTAGDHHIGTSEKEKAPAPAEEGDDEDIDALIAELESEDGDEEDEEEVKNHDGYVAADYCVSSERGRTYEQDPSGRGD